jgi:outer membrane protein TolC
MYALLLSSLIVNLIYVSLGAETLGDRVLEEREARLRELSSSLQPSKNSSLQGFENQDGKLELLDPATIAPTLTLAESIRLSLRHKKTQDFSELRLKRAIFRRRLTNPMRRLSAEIRTGVNLADNLGNDSRNAFHRHIFDLAHQEDAYYADLKLDYPILDGGISTAKEQMGRLEEEILEYQGIQEEQALIRRVAEVFVEVLVLEERLDLAHLRKQRAAEKLLRNERANSVNSSEALGILKSKIKLQQEEDQLSLLQTGRLALRQEFSSLVGLVDKPDFKIDKNARTRVIKETLEGLLKEASSQSPALKILGLKKKILQLQKSVILGKRGLSLDLFGKTSYSRLFDRNGLDEIRYLAGLEIGTHLLDGGQAATRLEVNRVESTLEDYHQNGVSQRINNEIRVNYLALRSAKTSIPIRKSHVRLARSLLLDAETDFNQKQVSKTALLDQRIAYREAILSYYQALQSFMHSKLKLFQAIGRLDETLFG